MVKKKSEEEIDTESKTIDEVEEVLDEESESSDFDNDEDYERYLIEQKKKIDSQLEKIKSKEFEKNLLKTLPEKLESIERAIEELQRVVKIMWSEKKK